MCLLVASFKHLLIVDGKKPSFFFFFLTIDFFFLILAWCTYKRKSAIGGNEDEKVKPFFDHNQLIGRHAENHEGEMLNKNKNMICQGMNANHYNI